MRKRYNPYDYTEVDELKLSEVYNWNIDNEEYFGTLEDFIDSFGDNRQYYIKCEVCGEGSWVLGSVIKSKGMYCHDCRPTKLKIIKKSVVKKPLSSIREDVLPYWSDTNVVSVDEVYGKEDLYVSGGAYLVCPSCGIEHKKSYVNILNTGAFCKSCARSANVSEEDSIWGKYPEVADWYVNSGENILDVKKVSVGSNREYSFQCPNCKSIFKSTPNSIISAYQKGNTGCPVCAGIKIVRGINDISAKNRPAFDLWDFEKNDVSPYEVLYSDQDYRWFRCNKEHHSFKSTPFRVLKSYKKDNNWGKNLCPVCSGREVIEGVNDVKTFNKWAYEQWDYEKNKLKPEEVYYKSDVPYWFRCKEGHSFKRAISGMLRSEKTNSPYMGCIICQGKSIIPGYNDLYTKFPDIVNKYWSFDNNEISPSEVAPYSGKFYFWRCSKCGRLYEDCPDSRVRGLGYCYDCRRVYSVSKAEVEIFDLVHKVFPDAKSQYKIEDMSYDICIESKKVLVEYNGVYYHSDAIQRCSNKMYHLNKLNLAKKYGYSLYVIWEDDWINHRDICLRGLYSKLGILNEKKVNARDCIVVESSVSSGLLSEYHIQGNPKIGCKFLLLKYKDEVVSELAYRIEKEGINIVRFASKYNVRGGFSKLLRVLELKGIDIIYTFSDNAVSEGNLYKKSGFVFDYELSPDYSYLYKDVRYHKFNFRKSRFEKDDKLLYVEGMSENELAQLNSIYKVWDYGKKRWVKHIVK